jgi:hypothetical protein
MVGDFTLKMETVSCPNVSNTTGVNVTLPKQMEVKIRSTILTLQILKKWNKATVDDS